MDHTRRPKRMQPRPFYAGFFARLALDLLCGLLIALNAYALDTAQVLHVVDGDTIKLLYRGTPESVRLIGIDTPESTNNPKTRRDVERSRTDIETILAMGKQAAVFTGSLVRPGDTVGLEFDAQERDRHGRILAYVYLKDGRMLNEEIAKAGFALPMTIPPNVKYADRFNEASRYARAHARGLW